MTIDIKILTGLEPMSSLSTDRLREILDYCHIETVHEGSNPLDSHGLEDQSVYLIDGELELIYRDGNRVVVSAQSEWAKHPLGKRQPHIVSALPLRECQLLRIDSELLDRIVALDQFIQNETAPLSVPGTGVGAGATTSIKCLLNFNMFSAENLNSGPLANLPMANISALLQRIEAITVCKGDVIIREGAEGDYYYLIDSGHAQVTRRVGGVDMLLANLEAGDVFGEEALVAGIERNATVTMKSGGMLLRIGREDFLSLLQEPLLHELNFEQALQAVEHGTLWLDVRHPSEYRHDRLHGAMNVPLNDIRSAIGVLDRNNKYIVYCQSGRRSAAAAFILAQAGYDVLVLAGGLWSATKSAQA